MTDAIYIVGNGKFITARGYGMKEILYVFGFLGIYILFQVVILPKMGIST